jgi:hypothetical protein
MSDNRTKGRTALELAQLNGRGEFGGAIARRDQKLTPLKGHTALELAQTNGRGELGRAIAQRQQKPKGRKP